MQPEFNRPEFLEGNSAEEIHERMMNNLPDDIDDMPGGFPYDMTMPAALEKDEIINFHIVRALMIAFPEYAWDEYQICMRLIIEKRIFLHIIGL